ncbi:MAG: hypothetical protein WCK00_04130, partial [Deltaproteobacteria bacterium]
KMKIKNYPPGWHSVCGFFKAGGEAHNLGLIGKNSDVSIFAARYRFATSFIEIYLDGYSRSSLLG